MELNPFLVLIFLPMLLKQANKNAALNGVQDICRFETANAFDVLKQWGKEGRQYDVVMLDPPAFTKEQGNNSESHYRV